MLAQELIILRATVVFGELDERLTSSEPKFRLDRFSVSMTGAEADVVLNVEK